MTGWWLAATRALLLSTSALLVCGAVAPISSASAAVTPGANGLLVFSENRQLYTAQPDGTGKTLIPAPPGILDMAAPAWSPDGRQIAYVGAEGDDYDLSY